MAASPKSIGEAISQVTKFFESLSTKQKVLLAGGSVAVIVSLVIFVRMINQPEMKVLASGLKANDAQALATKLGAKKIPYELSPDGGSIQVPSDKLDESRLELASQPNASGARLGFELFDKTNWVASDFDEKVNYQRAMEGELERTLQSLSGVEAVRVHLVLPPESVFTEKERDAKASVVLKLRGRSFTRDLHMSIARLVAGSVDKLDAQKVTVVDADTGQIFAISTDGTSPGGESLEQTLQARLLQTLEPIVGADHIRASVRVEYDLGTNEETQETYDPNGTVTTSTHKTEEQSGARIGGVAGATANIAAVPSAKSPTAAMDNGSSLPVSRSENNTYAVSRRVRHTLQPAGAVRRIAAAILVDDSVVVKRENAKVTTERQKRTPEQLQSLEQLAKAAIGIDANRGDILTVANMSFAETPADAPPMMTFLDRSRRTLNEWSWVVRLASVFALFLTVYLLLFRPIKKQIVASLRAPARLQGKLAGEGQGTKATEQVLMAEPERAESKRLSSLTKQLAAKVNAEPSVSSRLVQNWIGEAE